MSPKKKTIRATTHADDAPTMLARRTTCYTGNNPPVGGNEGLVVTGRPAVTMAMVGAGGPASGALQQQHNEGLAASLGAAANIIAMNTAFVEQQSRVVTP